MCSLQSKLATQNKLEEGRDVKTQNFLDWKNMAIDTSIAKAVNQGKKRPEKKENSPLDAAEANSLLIIPLIAPPLLHS